MNPFFPVGRLESAGACSMFWLLKLSYRLVSRQPLTSPRKWRTLSNRAVNCQRLFLFVDGWLSLLDFVLIVYNSRKGVNCHITCAGWHFKLPSDQVNWHQNERGRPFGFPAARCNGGGRHREECYGLLRHRGQCVCIPAPFSNHEHFWTLDENQSPGRKGSAGWVCFLVSSGINRQQRRPT